MSGGSAAVPVEEAAVRYGAFMEALDADDVARLGEVMDEAVRFRDPFSDVVGLDKVRAIFRHMFRDLGSPVFEITDQACSGQTAYLRWTFRFRPKAMGPGKPWAFEGMSAVTFGSDGRATEHLDFWDSGSEIYAKMPVLGFLIRRLRRRLGHA